MANAFLDLYLYSEKVGLLETAFKKHNLSNTFHLTIVLFSD
jgi:hypothetical protein